METIANKTCELCSMDATHSSVDCTGVTHYFCVHHAPTKNSTANTYKKLVPLFAIFAGILTVSVVKQLVYGVDIMVLMMDAMGLFFIVFAMFKLYDLSGFVQGFRTYDVIAKKWPTFGYIYPFVELLLGVLYLLGYMYLWQVVSTLILSALGVYSAYRVLRSQQKIRYVCLGTAFDLSMTSVTMAENIFMFAMAFGMFFI